MPEFQDDDYVAVGFFVLVLIVALGAAHYMDSQGGFGQGAQTGTKPKSAAEKQ